jgi:glycosyltransferase involved in cell wall biosynthesis
MDRTPENIANVMSQIVDMPIEEIDAMGERGRQLVEEKFTATSVAKQMKELYEWILGKREKPEFVYD